MFKKKEKKKIKGYPFGIRVGTVLVKKKKKNWKCPEWVVSDFRKIISSLTKKAGSRTDSRIIVKSL